MKFTMAQTESSKNKMQSSSKLGVSQLASTAAATVLLQYYYSTTGTGSITASTAATVLLVLPLQNLLILLGLVVGQWRKPPALMFSTPYEKHKS
jgi:ABC-type Fe3+-siderophore transport system permease subunit